MPDSVLVKSTITLSVAGVSRCVGFEANAAVSIIPAVVGVGLAIAFEVPVEVEACGVSIVPQEVEVRAWGPGLRFSSPWLCDRLCRLVSLLYEDESESPMEALMRDNDWGLEAAVASIHGSTMILLRPFKPLELPLQGYAVVARLSEPVEEVLEAIIEDSNADRLLQAVLSLDEDNLVYAINELTLRRVPLPCDVEEVLVKALSEGARAVALSCCGRLALALADDLEQAARISKVLSRLGSCAYAPLV